MYNDEPDGSDIKQPMQRVGVRGAVDGCVDGEEEQEGVGDVPESRTS